MIAVDKGFPRGFAVRFRELERWDPVSFERIIWHWSKELMVEIGSILKLRKEKVNRSRSAFSELQPITIHFDGSLDHRKVDGNREYKMDLFYAHPGDIVVAKIDLKNGAVAIVPMEWKNIVVTSHFAVYEPDRSKLLPEYFQRIIQTTFFKSLLWRNKVGAEGRKEVKLDFFESLHIPLPPLVVQHTILLRWQSVKNKVKSILSQMDHLIKTRNEKFYDDLGITVVSYKNRPKTFAVPWKISEVVCLFYGRYNYRFGEAAPIFVRLRPAWGASDCFLWYSEKPGKSPRPTSPTLSPSSQCEERIP